MDEETPSIVLDAGSSLVKAGLAGDDYPKVIFPSTVGTPLLATGQDDSSARDRFVGCNDNDERDMLSLRYPIQHGIVTDWNGMEDLLAHTYQQLNTKPEEHPVVFPQPPLNPKSNHECVAELMFEKFNVPSLYLADTSCLDLYCCGRNCGVMVEIGDGVSFAVPFYESYCMTNGIQRQDFAGRDVTLYLQKLLYEKGHSFTTTSEIEIVRDMKEKLCYTALDFDMEKNLAQNSADKEATYILRNGDEIQVKDERFQSTEILLQPSKFGFDGLIGIQDMIYKAVESCDFTSRPGVVVNLILSGGTPKCPGLAERLGREMKLRFPNLKVYVRNYPETGISVWIGGSILASLSAFQSSLISRQRYEEYGPSIVHRETYS